MRKAIRIILVLAILLTASVATPHMSGACGTAFPGDLPC